MSALSPIADSFPKTFLDAAHSALDQLLEDVPGVRSAVVASADGFELAVASRSAIAGERLSALSSSMLALAQASLRELRIEGSGSVLVESGGGKLLIAEIGSEPWPTVLCLVAEGDTMAGKLLWAARRCVGLLRGSAGFAAAPP